MDSILTTIKKLLGITEEYIHFDSDITIHINTALLPLSQLGINMNKPSLITGVEETWYDIFGNMDELESIKTYIYLKVKLVFDPPANSSLIEAMKNQIAELEWRLNIQVETT